MAESILGKINYLTEEQYQNAKANGQINENEIYMTPDDEIIYDNTNYSTEEVAIGKWFGKPLYRKVVQVTLPSTTSSWTVIANLGVNNVENVINFRGWFSWGGDQFFVLPMSEGAYFINLRMTKSGNIECIRNGWDALPAHIIVEYTKTTD